MAPGGVVPSRSMSVVRCSTAMLGNVHTGLDVCIGGLASAYPREAPADDQTQQQGAEASERLQTGTRA